MLIIMSFQNLLATVGLITDNTINVDKCFLPQLIASESKCHAGEQLSFKSPRKKEVSNWFINMY